MVDGHQVPQPSPAPDSRHGALIAGLRRQSDHIKRHAEQRDWPAMLAAMDRLEAVATAWHRSGTESEEAVQTFMTHELPALRTLFQQIQANLKIESRQIRDTRHKLRSVREFKPRPPQIEGHRRLNASA